MATLEELMDLSEDLSEIEADDEGSQVELDDIRKKVSDCCAAWSACEQALALAQARCAALEQECGMLKTAHEQVTALANGAHGHMKMYQDAMAAKDQQLAARQSEYDSKCQEHDEACGHLRDAQSRIENLQTMLANEQSARAAADDRLNQAITRLGQPRAERQISIPPMPEFDIVMGAPDQNGRIRSAKIKPVL